MPYVQKPLSYFTCITIIIIVKTSAAGIFHLVFIHRPEHVILNSYEQGLCKGVLNRQV